MPRPRDSQRKRVLDAENAVRTTLIGNVPPDVTAQANRVQELGNLFDRIARSAWWRKQIEPTSPFVKTTLTLSWCNATYCERSQTTTGYQVQLGQPDRNVLDAMHALAHQIAPADCALHGPEFAKAYLECVRKWIGADARAALVAAFKNPEHKVKYRVYSAASRQSMSDRGRARDLAKLLEELRG